MIPSLTCSLHSQLWVFSLSSVYFYFFFLFWLIYFIYMLSKVCNYRTFDHINQFHPFSYFHFQTMNRFMIANLYKTLVKFFHVNLKKLNTGLQFQLIFAKMLDITKHCYKGLLCVILRQIKGAVTLSQTIVNLKNSFC